MPQYSYRGRDKEGRLRVGDRFAPTIDNLNTALINEGIHPFQITVTQSGQPIWQSINDWFQDNNLLREELSIFSRQMDVLHKAGVPMVTALKQLGTHTRSKRLARALEGVVVHVERGESLATSMQQYPGIFSPLFINIVRIGETTGRLSEAFNNIHGYLAFEANNAKQIKSAFRYPLFVLSSIIVAIVILNIFVIPSFAKFYVNLSVSLPWETQLLIGTSYFFTHYGPYLLVAIIASAILFSRYLRTPVGRYQFDRLQLQVPLVGKLAKRIILIRFSQSLSIMLQSGISVTQSLELIKSIINNAYIAQQTAKMQEAIERGVSFSQALPKVDLFTPLEEQIIAVGEQNGELSSSLNYVANFHGQEIEFDLKRMNDLIGPILISAVSGIILIIALGIYLPIWNMINLVK